MTVSLNSNIASVVGQRRLADTSNALTRSLERLSSGSRINRASDDAAGLAVADSLRSKARVYTQGTRNLNDGISALSIADQALENLSRIVERQRELALQSANGILSSTQREALDTEAQALRSEYQRIVATTTFNGQGLLDRSLAGLNLQAGYGTGGILSLEVLGLTEEESTKLEEDILTQTISNFGSVVTLADVQFYVHDFNGDGVQDLFFLGRQSTGTATVTYGMGILLGDTDGTYSLSGPVRTTSIDPPGASAVQAFYVEVDTSSSSIDVYAVNNFGIDYARHKWTYDGNGLIETSPTVTTGSFGAFTGNTTSDPDVDLNRDGTNEQISVTLGFAGQFLVTTTVQIETPILIGAIRSLAQSSFSLLTEEDSESAIESLDDLASTLSDTRARIGASQSRINAALAVLTASADNMQAAESRIRDADIAMESAELTRYQVLQQTGAAVLAQANLQPQLAALLLGVGAE